MTDKELQKLGRRELLQLLLDQAKEAERLGRMLKETDEQLKQMEEGYERLRDRLDHKDAQIHELREALETERGKHETSVVDVGNLAEAALKLNGIFDAAQRAADQYLQSVREFYPVPDGVQLPPEPEPAARLQPPPPQPAASRPAPAPEPEPEPERRRPARNESRRPFGLRKQRENGKTTLFFGWQHD